MFRGDSYTCNSKIGSSRYTPERATLYIYTCYKWSVFGNGADNGTSAVDSRLLVGLSCRDCRQKDGLAVKGKRVANVHTSEEDAEET